MGSKTFAFIATYQPVNQADRLNEFTLVFSLCLIFSQIQK